MPLIRQLPVLLLRAMPMLPVDLVEAKTSNASRAWRPRLLGGPPENRTRTQIRFPRLCFERSMRVSLAATTSLEHLSEECGPCILPRLDSELKPDSSPSTESRSVAL